MFRGGGKPEEVAGLGAKPSGAKFICRSQGRTFGNISTATSSTAQLGHYIGNKIIGPWIMKLNNLWKCLLIINYSTCISFPSIPLPFFISPAAAHLSTEIFHLHPPKGTEGRLNEQEAMEEIRNLFLELQRIQERCPPRGLAVVTISAILDSCKFNGNNGISYNHNNNNNNSHTNPLALKAPPPMLMLQASSASPQQQQQQSKPPNLTLPQQICAEKQLSLVDKGTNTLSMGDNPIDTNNANDCDPTPSRFKASTTAKAGGEREGVSRSRLDTKSDDQEHNISQLRKCLQNCPVVSSNSTTSSAGDLLDAPAFDVVDYVDYDEENIKADTRSSDLDFANLQLECMCSSDSVIGSPTTSAYTEWCVPRKTNVELGVAASDDKVHNPGNNSMQNTCSAKNGGCNCTPMLPPTTTATLEQEVAAVVSYGQVLDRSGVVISQSARCYNNSNIGGDKSTNNGNCQVDGDPLGASHCPVVVEGGVGMPKGLFSVQKQKSLSTTIELKTTPKNGSQPKKRECVKTLSCGDVIARRRRRRSNSQEHPFDLSTTTTSGSCLADFRERLTGDQEVVWPGRNSSSATDNIINRSPAIDSCPPASGVVTDVGDVIKSSRTDKLPPQPTGGCAVPAHRKLNVLEGCCKGQSGEQEEGGGITGKECVRHSGEGERQVVVLQDELLTKLEGSAAGSDDSGKGHDGKYTEKRKEMRSQEMKELCVSQCHSAETTPSGNAPSSSSAAGRVEGNADSVISKEPRGSDTDRDVSLPSVEPTKDNRDTQVGEEKEEKDKVEAEQDQVDGDDGTNIPRQPSSSTAERCNIADDENKTVEDGNTTSIAMSGGAAAAASSVGNKKKNANSSQNSPDAKLVLDLNDKSKYTKEVSV